MKCPVCKNKMFCFRTKDKSEITYRRKYACGTCEKVFVGWETLEIIPYADKLPNWINKKFKLNGGT